MSWHVPAWYWIALIYGVAVPWVFIGDLIANEFKRGILAGLGTWSGACVVTIPPVFLIMAIEGWFLRLAQA
jgi:hypothetical protein